MNASEQYQTLARYNRWMNERLYEVCAGVPDEARKQDRGAFFKSVHGTLNHLLLADRLWLGRFTGTPFEIGSLDQELYADFETLHRERALADDAIESWASSLTDEKLGGTLAFTSVVESHERRYPLWFLVTHFFNHQTHHRGQLTTLLSQLHLDPGVTDLLYLPGIALD